MQYKQQALLLSLIAGLQVTAVSAEEPKRPVEEIVVTGKYVPDEKRITSEISSVLDEEALNVLPDSTVGDVLTRMTGVSLVDGKYVYVRGLGERYSSTLLDRSRVSSPVPFQKTVPLDLFPTSVVRNLVVQKTYSAQYPGDFGGGVVLIRSKATPNESYFTVKLGSGGNSTTTGGEGLDYRGGDYDNFGFDDGTRHLPDNVRDLPSEAFEATDFPESAVLGASFFNFWEVREKDTRADLNGEIEAGHRIDFDNGMSVGVVAAGKYGSDWKNTDKELLRYEFTGVNGGSNQTVDFDQFTTRQTINLSGFLNLGFEFNDNNSVSLTHVLLRQSDNEVQQERGLSSEDDVTTGTQVASYRFQWTENEISSTQLKGEHYFNVGPIEEGAVNWRAVLGKALRESPDTRTYTYAENNDGAEEVVTPNRQAAGDLREVFQAPDRLYADLSDDIKEFGFDVELPMTFGNVDITVEAGYAMFERVRDSEDRLFRFDLDSSAPDALALATPRDLFSAANWSAGYVSVRDFTASAANASGIFPFAKSGEESDAFYLAADAQIMPRLRLQVSVRKEDTMLFADAFGGNTEAGTINAVAREYDDVLPAVTITAEPFDNMQVRLGYSQTVNRPNLLELTGSTLRNPEDSNDYRGNVHLAPADLDNYDVRFEWYFGDADSASIGFFRKDFHEPIELGKVQAQNDIFTWFNAEEAELNGVELEVRKDLLLSSWFGLGSAWEYFTLSANVTFMDSEVMLLGADETAANVPLTGGRQLARLFKNERAITGQSDILGNLILSYQNDDLGITGSLAYNYTGERVILVGSDNSPDIREEGRGQLDLKVKYGFRAFKMDLEAELTVSNVLDTDVELKQGSQMYERHAPGMGYSFGIKTTF